MDFKKQHQRYFVYVCFAWYLRHLQSDRTQFKIDESEIYERGLLAATSGCLHDVNNLCIEQDHLRESQ